MAASIAAGILLDEFVDLPAYFWGVACGLLLIAGCMWLWQQPGQRRIVAALLLAGCAALGASRHHAFSSIRSANDISRYADGAPLVQISGTVASSVSIRGNSLDLSLPSWRRHDQSFFDLRVSRLIEDSRDIDVEGLVRVDVDGVVTELEPGDHVELFGRLARPSPPAAQGDFDFQAFLRRQGIDCVVRCEHPDAVRKTGREMGLLAEFARCRDRVRKRAEHLCAEYLSPDHRAVAESILLGVRSHLTDDTREQFIESGTMHLLAISGLHVGILLTMVWCLCNLLNLSTTSRAFVVVVILLSYTLLTDVRPPVLRASILGILMVVGHQAQRPISSRNLLAVAIILILLWRPTDLFDAGAQLSFLCVATIIEVTSWNMMLPSLVVPVTDETRREVILRRTREVIRRILQLYIVSSAVWLASVPLTAWHFQLLAPIGTLLNVLLVPFAAVLLWPGFLFLGVGLVAPAIVAPMAYIFDAMLGVLLACTQWASSIEVGHFFTPAPPLWWVLGFYLLLIGAFRWIPSLPVIVWSRRLLLIWSILGLLPLAAPRPTDELRVSFLPVGHGGCILIECPAGRTVLYDCGSFSDGNRAANIVFATLSARDIPRIDALFVSHADSDHYNGIMPLIERVPVGTVYMPRGFLDFEQPLVEMTCDALARTETPMRILAAGDVPQIDASVSIQVLHPPDAFEDDVDNAESLVVLIEYAGRRVLLMGDLEGAGFVELSSRMQVEPIDILQSPHHGSPRANSPQLNNWATPRWVMVCTGPNEDLSRLEETFSSAQVLSTGVSGTITCVISNDGELNVEEYCSSE